MLNFAESRLTVSNEKPKHILYIALSVLCKTEQLEQWICWMHVIGFIQIINRFVHEFLMIFTFWRRTNNNTCWINCYNLIVLLYLEKKSSYKYTGFAELPIVYEFQFLRAYDFQFLSFHWTKLNPLTRHCRQCHIIKGCFANKNEKKTIVIYSFNWWPIAVVRYFCELQYFLKEITEDGE